MAYKAQYTKDRFQGERVIVTGGASGIGLAIATSFACLGARVAVVDVNKGLLDEAVAAIGNSATGYVCDVSSWSAQCELFEKVTSTTGAPTIVCLNAGVDPELAISNPRSSAECKKLVRYNYLAHELDVKECNDNGPPRLKQPPTTIFDVNFYGVLYGIKLASYYMRENGGRIIVTGSAASYIGFPHQDVYVASKHALLGLVRATANRRQNTTATTGKVTLSMLAPWLTDTPLTRANSLFEGIKSTPQSSTPSDVARAVLRLSAMEPDLCHGRCLWVRGNTTLEVEEAYEKWVGKLGKLAPEGGDAGNPTLSKL
ncbi:hypothetical protein BJX64DRAFT_282021 [Aspergillus heterothallicus]